MEKIIEKAKKSALTPDELKKIVEGKRINADTVAAAFDKARFSEKSYYDVNHIEDPAARAQAIESARGDNCAIFLKMKEAYDNRMALAKPEAK